MIPQGIAQWLLLSNLENLFYVIFKPLKMSDINIYNLMVVCTIMVLVLYYCAWGRRMYEKQFIIPIKIWYLLDGIMFVLVFMMAYFSCVIIERNTHSGIYRYGTILIVLGNIFIYFMLILILYCFNNMNYYQQGKYDKLGGYLNSMLGTIRNISNYTYDVGNDIVNAVINYYLLPICSEYDVTVKGVIGEKINIEQRDLCIITANLIKNAVEAVQKEGQGEIVLQVEKGKDTIAIIAQNSYKGRLRLDQEGNLITTKTDKKQHGYGLQSVRTIVKKYQGIYRAKLVEERYIVEVYLKN